MGKVLAKIILAAMPLLCFLQANATVKTITSPDGKTTVMVSDENGQLTYDIHHDGKAFMMRSPLGLKLNFNDLTQQLTLASCEEKTVRDEYHLKTIKQSHVSYEATEATLAIEKNGRKVMDVVFRLSNRDVAFRYQVYPRRETLAGIVESEASGFVLPEGTTTFLCPQSKPMGGFARTSPSYETSYTLDEPAGKNGWGEGYTFPCLFKTPSG